MTIEQELEALREKIRDIEEQLRDRRVPPHAAQHELPGTDTVRLSVQNSGTQLNRHRTLNFSTGLTASENADNKRIDVVLADHDHTGDAGDGGKVSTASLSDFTDWTNWTPTVDQGGSVTVTVNEAKYCLIGKVCHIYAKLSVTGTGTSGNDIYIAGQPAAARPANLQAFMAMGTFIVKDASGNTSYVGSLYNHGTATNWRLRVNGSNGGLGTDPAFALGNTDVIAFTATYRVA